jgi:hypothetical protein
MDADPGDFFPETTSLRDPNGEGGLDAEGRVVDHAGIGLMASHARTSPQEQQRLAWRLTR